MRRSIRSVRNATSSGALALAPLLRAVRVADGHTDDGDRARGHRRAGRRREGAACADDDLSADLLAQDPVRRADVASGLGRDGRGLEPEPVLADRRRSVVDDLVLRRAPVCASERSKRGSSSCDPDDVRRENAERLLEQLLSCLVALEDDDGVGVHRAPSLCASLRTSQRTSNAPLLRSAISRRRSGETRSSWQRAAAGGGSDLADGSATSTRAATASPTTAKLERIDALKIPPAWRDVCISPKPGAKVQATGYDKAGRKQYLYHAEFRAAQEQAKFDKLIRFGETLPAIRRQTRRRSRRGAALAALDVRRRAPPHQPHLVPPRRRSLHRELRRHDAPQAPRRGDAEQDRVLVQGEARRPRAHRSRRRRARPGAAPSARRARRSPALPLRGGGACGSTSPRGGSTTTSRRRWARGSAPRTSAPGAGRSSRRSPSPSGARPTMPTQAKRTVAAACRSVSQQLGNTPAVCRASYISPAVIDQYLEGRTIETFRRRHLRVVGARDVDLDPEEQALLSLLRSWRMRRAREAA